MRGSIHLLAAISALGIVAVSTAHGQGFGTARQVTNVANVSAVAHPPGDRTRLFILTLRGMVHIIENGTTLRTPPFLDATAAVGSSQNGASGLCFDPDFATNGFLYIFHSLPNSQVALARYRVSDSDPHIADPASRLVLLQRPGSAQHTGGWIDFGRDGYLYISGGDAWSFTGSPQNNTHWTGKFFRLDVRGDGFPEDPLRNYAIPPSNPFVGAHPGLDEVWAMGIRNAYRCSFDRLTGDLWIADVGGTQREEVNRQPAGSIGGENYGWPCREGFIPSSSCPGNTAVFTPPVVDLNRNQINCILGGYVYRGCANRALYGHYIFGRCSGGSPLWTFDPARPIQSLTQRAVGGLGGSLLGFGEDADGEVYACTTTGLFKLMPPADSWILDCNANGRDDACEIKDGSAPDTNGDGLPDSCTRLCPADFDASGAVGVGDVFWYLNRWFALAPEADFDGMGGVALQDLFGFLAAYFRGCV